MIRIDEKQLIKIIKRYLNKKVYIQQSGIISSMNTINKLNYIYYNNFIILKDKISKNYFTININYVYKILVNKEKTIIKVFIDEGIVVTIKY